ncbi:MAG: hypothetical protein PHS44_02250 [Candidatus Dojkabacteria bacterium]|jgi:hypothetical protein|nr:hypothetical protein [Candidatus Dojkabacteria bacterium]
MELARGAAHMTRRIDDYEVLERGVGAIVQGSMADTGILAEAMFAVGNPDFKAVPMHVRRVAILSLCLPILGLERSSGDPHRLRGEFAGARKRLSELGLAAAFFDSRCGIILSQDFKENHAGMRLKAFVEMLRYLIGLRMEQEKPRYANLEDFASHASYIIWRDNRFGSEEYARVEQLLFSLKDWAREGNVSAALILLGDPAGYLEHTPGQVIRLTRSPSEVDTDLRSARQLLERLAGFLNVDISRNDTVLGKPILVDHYLQVVLDKQNQAVSQTTKYPLAYKVGGYEFSATKYVGACVPVNMNLWVVRNKENDIVWAGFVRYED